MDDLHRAIFVGLAVANIPASAWSVQIFENHIHHDGSVTSHNPIKPTSLLATITFGIHDPATDKDHTIAGTVDITNGHTTFTIDGGSNLPLPQGHPQIDPGIEPEGSQIWFRYDDTGTLREYRFHTNTNFNALADALKLHGLPDFAQLILNSFGI